MSRPLKCPGCKQHKAKVWGRMLSPGLFVGCSNCGRCLHGPTYRLKAGGRHGFLVDMSKKELADYREKLLSRWRAGETTPTFYDGDTQP